MQTTDIPTQVETLSTSTEPTSTSIQDTKTVESDRIAPWIAARAVAQGVAPTRPVATGARVDQGSAADMQQPSSGAGKTLSMHAGLGSPAPAEQGKSVCEIPAGLFFEGSASYPCSVTVKGRVKGSIKTEADADLRVAVGGEVDGDMKAKSIVIEGSAKGTIDASGGIASFGPEAHCNGTILYARVSIAEGAEIEATMKKSI